MKARQRDARGRFIKAPPPRARDARGRFTTDLGAALSALADRWFPPPPRPTAAAAIRAAKARAVRPKPAAAVRARVRVERRAEWWADLEAKLGEDAVAFEGATPAAQGWDPWETRLWQTVTAYNVDADEADVLAGMALTDIGGMVALADDEGLWDAGASARIDVHFTLKSAAQLPSYVAEYSERAWGRVIAVVPAALDAPDSAQWLERRERRWASDAAQEVKAARAEKQARRRLKDKARRGRS